MEPKRGRRFIHSRWVDENRQKTIECVITRLTASDIYYRTTDNGSKWRVSREQFPASVLRWVD